MFKDNFSRYEFKFPMSYDDMDRMIDDLIPYVKQDKYVNEFGIYTISSMYMDNVHKECYYETLNNDFYRQKVRLRVYGRENTADSDAFLELKTKIDGLVVKRRVYMKLSDAVAFINECIEKGTEASIEYKCSNPQILKEIKHVIIRKELKPVNVISYERLPLVSVEDSALRITFDFNIRSRGDDLDLTHGTHGDRRIPKQVAILEVKTNKAIPFWLTKILSKYKYRNQTFSKYCSHYAPMRILSDININENKGEENENVESVHRKFNIG